MAGDGLLRPDFLQPLTADIGRVGALGACILALVRYATTPTDEEYGRRVVDGKMRWRASAPEIAEALGGGISPRTVSDKVKQLIFSGDLTAIPTQDFYGDRAKAYRASDLPSAENGTGSDLPSADNADRSADIAEHVGRKRRTTSADIADLPSIEEVEEEREKASAAETAEPLDVETVPGNRNAPTPPESSEDQPEPVDGEDNATVLEESKFEPAHDPRPEPKCKRHPDGDVGEPCRACKRDNDAIEAWQQRQKEVAQLRILSSVAESPRTERPPPEPKPPAPSWIHGTYGPRCPRHGHLKVAPADCDRCRDAANAAKESA